jgi:hypothetical protein
LKMWHLLSAVQTLSNALRGMCYLILRTILKGISIIINSILVIGN